MSARARDASWRALASVRALTDADVLELIPACALAIVDDAKTHLRGLGVDVAATIRPWPMSPPVWVSFLRDSMTSDDAERQQLARGVLLDYAAWIARAERST